MKLSDLPEACRQANPQLFPPLPQPESGDGKQSDLERDLQRLCEQELSRRGIWYQHLSFRAREKAGIPDLIFVVKNYHRTVGIYTQPWAIELKSPTGRLSDAQKATLAQMEGNGWYIAVIRSYEEFRRVVFGEAKEG